ncbi:hypothetical protein HBO12_16750 [Pseudomonas sp. WS 5059]|uniref:hypothetical protein n=1 Tax=Pseudomonas sp. WS 5059 TaxID=2717491 RepID=UPI001472F2B0|nr:hypothetical protein [Pseudomonas sp. WS 5059]NMY04610.1 hypothetical protein [Pseudomonas sp. WS 5059]
MSQPTNTTIIPHVQAGSYMDEQVDQFDAFAISWNEQDAVHLTFGRTSLLVKTSRIMNYADKPADIETGEAELFRLDVGAVTMPIETARSLAKTLSRMVEQSDARKAENE